jgi:hypothetical protein
MIVQWLTGVEIAKIGRSFQLSAFKRDRVDLLEHWYYFDTGIRMVF